MAVQLRHRGSPPACCFQRRRPGREAETALGCSTCFAPLYASGFKDLRKLDRLFDGVKLKRFCARRRRSSSARRSGGGGIRATEIVSQPRALPAMSADHSQQRDGCRCAMPKTAAAALDPGRVDFCARRASRSALRPRAASTAASAPPSNGLKSPAPEAPEAERYLRLIQHHRHRPARHEARPGFIAHERSELVELCVQIDDDGLRVPSALSSIMAVVVLARGKRADPARRLDPLSQRRGVSVSGKRADRDSRSSLAAGK